MGVSLTLTFTVFTSIVLTCSAQVPPFKIPSDGSVPECPTVPIVKKFETEKYLGRWYEIQRLFNRFQSGGCVTADYSLLPNCSIGVTNSQILENGSQTVAKGLAHSAGDPTRGSLTVKFPNEPNASQSNREGNYNVLATDYSNYAVVYSCSVEKIQGRDVKIEFSWILARRPLLNRTFLTKLMGWMKRLGINTNNFMATRQANCQYTAA